MMDPRTRAVPLVPFVLAPGNYAVMSGGMVRALAGPDAEGRRQEGFTVKTRYSAPFGFATKHEEVAEAFGVDTGHNPGIEATEFLRRACKGRALLIVPALSDEQDAVLKDDQGRLIADLYISGELGPRLEIANAVSAYALMTQNRQATAAEGLVIPDDPQMALMTFPNGVRSVEIVGARSESGPGFS